MGNRSSKSELLAHSSYITNSCVRNVKESASLADSISQESNIKPDLQKDCCKIWPNGVLYYNIDESLFPYPWIINNINEAISEFHKATPILFKHNHSEQDIKDWILFKFDDKVSSSFIGRIGGEQEIRLSPGTRKGNVMHEIMHALGFYHDISQVYRDSDTEIQTQRSRDMSENSEMLGYPLGSYDPESIIHYGTHGVYMNTRTSLSSKINKQEHLSDGDIKAIKYLYSDPICTYDAFGEEYYLQSYYECITCWGRGSVYGLCKYCKEKCHADHEVKFHHYSEIGNRKTIFICDCGTNRHMMNVCTRLATNETRVKQMLYICQDCFEVDDYKKNNRGRIPVVCKACIGKCHSGHQYQEYGLAVGFCDCGKKCCKILCRAR